MTSRKHGSPKVTTKHIYKITYPNGKIYVGMDLTGDIPYVGSPSARDQIAHDHGIAPALFPQRPLQRQTVVKGGPCHYTIQLPHLALTLVKEILWASDDATDAEVRALEGQYIRDTYANHPEIGYNKLPRYLRDPDLPTDLPQIWHPVTEWEEVEHNMWGKVEDRAAYLSLAVKFTGNHVRYGKYMRRVVDEWPISTENALTDPHLNHRAWLGHAAAALALRCPEDITRQAWKYLTDEQKLLANQEADRAISAWRRTYIKNRRLRRDMEDPMLPGFDT